MISFIVIGLNVSSTISRCFESIYNTISLNRINNYEAIYIDSNSSDDSIEKVKSFKNVTIYKISKNANPAVSRNLGANKSKGSVFFFY